MRRFFPLVCLCFFVTAAWSQGGDKKMDTFITKLMAKMTRTEMLGQLNLLTQSEFITGEARNSGFEKKLREGKVGAVLNMTGARRIREAQRVAVEETRLGIPLLFGFDVIHGYKTIFPIPLAQSCTWDLEAIERAAAVAAVEATASGLNWTYSPMVDICQDARWGRIAEGAGEDPYLGSLIARSMVMGIQGDGSYKDGRSMLACMKHYALYGAASSGLDYSKADMSRHTMYNEFFPPYKAAVEAGVASVMASFNEVEGLPATGNRWLMTDLLRGEWGFRGFVVSDYTGVSEMEAHGMATKDNSASQAINAGVDMDMVSERYLSLTEEDDAAIKTACHRVLEAKYKLGLFDDPYKYCQTEREGRDVYIEPHLTEAENMARESFVLLKNKDNTLPLKGTERVALIGPLADSHGELLGSWCAHGDWRKTPSLREALKERLGADKVLYAKGCNIYYDKKLNAHAQYPEFDSRPAEEMMQEALKVAEQADIIMVAMGETANMSGESASRASLDMPDAQRDLLKELVKLGKPVVMVLMNGRPMSIVWENEHLDAILDVWFGGSRAASAIVSTLYGENNPQGRLTTTFPQTVGQEPMHYNHKSSGRPLAEGRWFSKYRNNYIDVSNDPLYPFGYGLSYTTFEYGKMALSGDKMSTGSKITATVSVRNTGSREGVEVVQLYIRDVVASSTRPVKELKDFKRIALKAGEEKTVSFTIDVEKLKYYDYNLRHVAEPGEFEVMIGRDSRDLQSAKFVLE